MKPNSLYAQLELIPETPSYPAQTEYSLGRAWAIAKARLSPIASALLAHLCGATDLQVVRRRDRQGNTLFVVYDPIGQRRHRFYSEHDLRVWIDQRYNQ